jgi:hypothetical protein
MSELLKINVSKKELDEGIIPTNHVLCYAHYSNENLTTKSGIIIGVNKELLYSDSDNLDDDSAHNADLAEVSMVVYKLPQKLYFNTEDREKSMPWLTDMEICEDDEIFTNTIDSLNAVTLVCEGKLYKLINYSDIYCAKREIWVDKWSVPQKKKTAVEVFNGYVLVILTNKESISELDVTSADKLDKTKGIIAYIGNPVKRYLNPDYAHIEDLRVGDKVLFSAKSAPFALERQKYASKFDENQIYYVIHRKDINAVLSRK